MIPLRHILVVVCLSFGWFAFAQNANNHNLIQGEWETEGERNNALLFNNKLMYHAYNNRFVDTAKYYFIDNCRFAKNKGDFIMFVNELNIDTTYFEILGLTQKRLTLLDLSTNGQFWVLKRKNKTK